MEIKGLNVGDLFDHEGRMYRVKQVLASGDYISVAIDQDMGDEEIADRVSDTGYDTGDHTMEEVAEVIEAVEEDAPETVREEEGVVSGLPTADAPTVKKAPARKAKV